MEFISLSSFDNIDFALMSSAFVLALLIAFIHFYYEKACQRADYKALLKARANSRLLNGDTNRFVCRHCRASYTGKYDATIVHNPNCLLYRGRDLL